MKKFNNQNNHNTSSQHIKQQQESQPKTNQCKNLIQLTRRVVKNLNKKQRLQKARNHLFDALQYKSPRPEAYDKNQPCLFRYIYRIQTSILWSQFLFILSYVFMYLVVLDNNSNYVAKLVIQWFMLVVLWFDVAFQIYHKSFQTLRRSSKFQARFYARIIILILLVIDEILFAILFRGGRPIRPFLILRAILPVFYDHFVRKSLQALIASYKDIIVYLMFYATVIVTFALITYEIVQIPQGVQFDPYREDYQNFYKTIYITYVLSSYDSYPDNQLIAIRQSEWNYIIFIVFIFLNVFFFVVIPATIIFNSFRDTRSKILLIDQIKQQHSLILCFVSLEQADNFNIKINDLIQFLLYVYKNKVRYIDYITQVCLKLDDNNNQTIQVNQFMQLCKILQSNTAMLPPLFSDFQPWIRFRKCLAQTTNIDKIANSNIFYIIECVIIILCFVNGVLMFVYNFQVSNIIDYIFTGLFVTFLIIAILGKGLQDHFEPNINKVDAVIVILALVFDLLYLNAIQFKADVLLKMIRIYKIYRIFEIIGLKQNGIYRRVSQLFIQIAIILPIILKFFPMIMIIYYILGIIGMECFYTQLQIDSTRNPYAMYEQYSNFKYFLGTQYIMVQILVEAGWSMVGFDYSQIFGNYGLVMLYFILCHIITDLILTSLLKGLVWEVYSSVNNQYKSRKSEHQIKRKKQEAIQKKKHQIEEIKQQFEQDINFHRLNLVPNTILKKQLYENRIDSQILSKLKKMYNQMHPNKRVNRSQNLIHTFEDQKILLSQIKIQTHEDTLTKIISKDRQDNQLNRKLPDQFQDQMQKLIGSIIIRPNTMFSQVIFYPKPFVTYLQNKLTKPMEDPKYSKLFAGFDLDQNQIHSSRSLNLLTSQLNSILNIQKSKKQQKTQIVASMIKKKYISQEVAQQLLAEDKEYDGSQRIDISWVVRDTFLGHTNEDLIKKFQIQYFSDIYGRQFRQINKVTLEPLLRYQATLTYCFRNLLRYPNINQLQFFTILSKLQDNFSNKVLKKGSLFKFVYHIETISDTWFSIQLKQNKDTMIHFIKSGVWVYTPNMKAQTVYFGDDIFNWKDKKNQGTSKICQGYMKKFYQSFESLAFCLLDQQKFFSGNPNGYIYDLFSWYIDVRKTPRQQTKKDGLRISKIMLVILSKQQERQQKLGYELSQLSKQQFQNQGVAKKKNLQTFRYDQSEDQTFQKLKNLSIMDHQKIVETQGLPYSFILNLITQISMTLQNTRNQKNFVDQIQILLNKQFEQREGQKKPKNYLQALVREQRSHNQFQQKGEIQLGVMNQIQTHKNQHKSNINQDQK